MAIRKAAKKTPLQKVKEELQEANEQLAKFADITNVLEKQLDSAKEANKALSAKLEFEDDYEGLRTFLLERLKNKRPEFVNFLFTNVKETINIRHMCSLSSLKDAARQSQQIAAEIETKIEDLHSRMI